MMAMKINESSLIQETIEQIPYNDGKLNKNVIIVVLI